MGEFNIFLNPNVTTGEMRDASGELTIRGIRVAEVGRANVNKLVEHLGDHIPPVVLQHAINQLHVPRGYLREWDRYEIHVAKMLASVSPDRTGPMSGINFYIAADPSAVEKIPADVSSLIAMTFFDRSIKYFCDLESLQASTDLDTLTFTQRVYDESRRLRLAVYRGVLTI